MRQSDATRRTTRRRFRRSVLAALALAGVLAIPAAAEAQSVTITVDITGTGSGSVTSSPSGISCSGSNTSCTASFTSGTAITLTATADSGKTFTGWTGICSGTGTCQFNAAEGVLAVAPFSSPTAAAVTYYHHDAVGSVRALTDASGTVVIRHDYFPFGEDTQPLTGDPLRFTGQEIDPESGQHHFQARQYRNIWGRFTTVDPGHVNGSLTDPQGWNGYAYARNNPLKFTDPTGQIYRLCEYGYSCFDYPDADFETNFMNAGNVVLTGLDPTSVGASGSIYIDGVDEGTYEHLSCDGTIRCGPSPEQVGWNWLTGQGPEEETFSDGDEFTEKLKTHGFIQDLVANVCSGAMDPVGRATYDLGGFRGVPKYLNDYSTLLTAGRTGNLAVTYLGSYQVRYQMTEGSVRMQVRNTTSLESGLRPPVLGYTALWRNTVGRLLRVPSGWPLSSKTQVFGFSHNCP